MTVTSRPRPPVPAAPTAAPQIATVQFNKPAEAAGHRIVLYGPGGIGKTTLAAQLPGPVVFFDLDESLARLKVRDVTTARSVSWSELRAQLGANGWDGVKSIVIDTATRAEELCETHVVATIPHEKGHKVNSLEGYGFGKGVVHLFDTFLPLLGDLDRHARAGRNVVLICHDCTASVPNPSGEDWLRYEPRLNNPRSGKDSIRLRVREWADHVFCIMYDVAAKDGKGYGKGTRTLYRAETPACMAKWRAPLGASSDPIPLGTDASAVWNELLNN